jgi:hypothetical protein
VGNENADAKYDYNSCDGLEQNLSGAIVLSNERIVDALTTGDLPKFKFICDGCGSTSIKVAYPERAPETTVVECGRCNAPRGTLAALRDLARQGRNDFFDF